MDILLADEYNYFDAFRALIVILVLNISTQNLGFVFLLHTGAELEIDNTCNYYFLQHLQAQYTQSIFSKCPNQILSLLNFFLIKIWRRNFFDIEKLIH